MTYKIFLILSINFSTTIRPTVKQWTCQSINNPSISLDEYSCDKSAISLVSTCRPSICRNLIEPSSTSTIVTLRQHTLSCGMSTASPKQCVQFRRWRPATDGDVRCLMNGPSASKDVLKLLWMIASVLNIFSNARDSERPSCTQALQCVIRVTAIAVWFVTLPCAVWHHRHLASSGQFGQCPVVSGQCASRVNWWSPAHVRRPLSLHLYIAII